MKTPRSLYILPVFLGLIACSRQPRFIVEGTVQQADKQSLYLERVDLQQVKPIDSTKLDKTGHFKFKLATSRSPEFYRLRLGNELINLAIDSAGTVTIQADGKNFSTHYRVAGSPTCQQIRELTLRQQLMQHKADSLKNRYQQQTLTEEAYQQALLQTVEAQRRMNRQLIFNNPASPAAYFALFQRVNDYLLFNVYDPEDNKLFAAVATSWQQLYPESQRTTHLVNLTLQGMGAIRKQRQASQIPILEASEAHLFEIHLPDKDNHWHDLSDLKGKVVLLDFTVYASKDAPSRNLYFRELVNKFSDKGFMIYQVSFDPDEHFWKTGASHLPWICVRDAEGGSSPLISTFNIQELPTYFLLNRAGELVARDKQITDLEKAIQQLL